MQRILFFRKPATGEPYLRALQALLDQREREAKADEAAYRARKKMSSSIVSAREVIPARRAGGRR